MRFSQHDAGNPQAGLTVLEIVVAIFILGCISAAAFSAIAEIERIRGRVNFVDAASRLAAGESERLRSIAACATELVDSSYTQNILGRSFKVERKLIEDEEKPSFQLKAREPYQVEIIVSDNNNATTTPLRFKMLVGQDRP